MDHFEFEKKKKRKLRKEPIFIFLCILCLVIGGLGGFYVASSSQSSNQGKTDTLYNQISNLIEDKFLDTTDSQYSIQERILAGMVGGLGDPHTSYLTSEAANDLTESINGSFEGIGVSFQVVPSGGLVLETFKGSPAQKAGLLAGDIITHVQGTAIAGYDSDKVKSMIVGENGTKVSLSILRDGQKKSFEVNRGSVESSVGYEIKTEGTKKLGYLRITTFGSSTTSLVEEALKMFQNNNVKNICIDLRGNGGGYIEAAQGLLDLFIPENQLMFKVQYKDNGTQEYKASSREKYTFEQGYVLVNGNTASASEVMTSALSEILHYQVVGEKTYGKGTVQSQIPLSNSSIIKMTVAKWLTSKGVWVNEKGITPDYTVEKEELKDYNINELKQDYQYDQVDDAISSMQKILKTLDYQVDRTDGYFSKQTETAFKQFEKTYGLQVNGIYEKNDATILLSALTHHVYQKALDTQYQKVVSLIK